MSLAEFGGHIDLNKCWVAYSVLNRMKSARRKAATSKSKHSAKDFTLLKNLFCIICLEEICALLIFNCDQTGIRIAPFSPWTMAWQGARRVELISSGGKKVNYSIFCGSLVGDFLPTQLIYKGKTSWCHPKFKSSPDWDITHTPKHWSKVKRQCWSTLSMWKNTSRYTKWGASCCYSNWHIWRTKRQCSFPAAGGQQHPRLSLSIKYHGSFAAHRPNSKWNGKRVYQKMKFEEWYAARFWESLMKVMMKLIVPNQSALDFQI